MRRGTGVFRHRALLVALVVTLGSAGILIPKAHVQASGNAYFNAVSQKCLDDTNWSTSWGQQMQTWSCTGNSNQDWYVINPNNTVFELMNGYSALCLDVWQNGSANLTKAVQWPCNANDAAEQFRWIPEDYQGNYWWQIYNDHNMCLDVYGGGTGNGTPLEWYSCNGTGAQAWDDGWN